MATKGNIQKGLEEAVMPVSSATVTVVLRDGLGYALLAYGLIVPDTLAGYAIGCIFIHTDGTAGTTLYANEGTTTTADFDAITVA
jgi:hypothetical protein